MNQQNLTTAPMFAFNNRDKLGVQCGCYSCCAVFPATDIVEWTDNEKTAICPKCKTDSVLSESVIGKNNPESVLRQINEYWFNQNNPSSHK